MNILIVFFISVFSFFPEASLFDVTPNTYIEYQRGFISIQVRGQILEIQRKNKKMETIHYTLHQKKKGLIETGQIAPCLSSATLILPETDSDYTLKVRMGLDTESHYFSCCND